MLVGILIGALAGASGSLPLFLSLVRSDGEDIARAFGALIFSFVVISAALLAVKQLLPHLVLPVGISGAFTLLFMCVTGVYFRAKKPGF